MKIDRRHFFKKSSLLSIFGASALAAGQQSQNKQSVRITEEVPVIDETDVCVIGGSCTGVFAAIRAARLGARVTIIEKQSAFGGVATNSLVNVWHSLYDTEYKQQIIAGLTLEAIELLKKRDAVEIIPNNPSVGEKFNPHDLKIVLDNMVLEAGITPWLHTVFSAPVLDESGKLAGIVVENKSGRGCIKAKMFIDASGDGDLCHRLGLTEYTFENLNPPTTCALLEGWEEVGPVINDLLKEHREEFDLPEGFIWGGYIPHSKNFMMAGTRVYNVNCDDARDLTHAEIEGRRQVSMIMEIVKKYTDQHLTLTGLPSNIGIRETRHIKCRHQVTSDEILYGKRFPDAIANGSYRVDIHHQDKPGITFKYLDGTQVYNRPGYPEQVSRWREKTDTNPTFYQIPLSSLLPPKYDNLVLAGRMLDAEQAAFSGVRVMVNMNQTGEAAGTAAVLAMEQNQAINRVSPADVRKSLEKGGSIIF